MNEVQKSLDETYQAHLKDKQEWRDILKQSRKQTEETERKLATIKSKMRSARASDYAQWVFNYLKQGGKITHFYDYDMCKIHEATHSFTIPDGTCGSLSFGIIVPKGVEVLHERHDHCTVYDSTFSASFVPMYSDVKVALQLLIDREG